MTGAQTEIVIDEKWESELGPGGTPYFKVYRYESMENGKSSTIFIEWAH